MNNKELLVELSKRLGKTQKEIKSLLSQTTSCLIEKCEEGVSIPLQGFGNFEVRKKNDRILVNPSTHQRMIVPPKLVLVFKASNTYKNRIKEKILHGK